VLLGAAYSRAAERQADATAIEILNKAGIKGGPFADLLVRAEEGKEIPELISSHPGAKERARAIRRQARGRMSAFTDAEWRAIRRACG
jgi:predicted Zn-dependent protease